MSTSQTPGGGGESYSYPWEWFEVPDMPAIEALTWQDDQGLFVLWEENLPYPVQVIAMEVDGSSSRFGEYRFTTRIQLRDLEDGDERFSEFIDTFVDGTNAVNIGTQDTEEEDDAYLFVSPNGGRYTLDVDEFNNIYIRTAAGKHWSNPFAIPLAGVSLQHNLDVEAEVFEDFIALSETVVQRLYRDFGENNIKLELKVAPLQTETDAEPDSEESEDSGQEAKVRLDDLGGIDAIKEQLLDSVIAMQNPEIMAAWGADRPSGILLYGPAGTGKTTLAEAVANEVGAELRLVKSPDIYGKWVGDSEKNFQAIIDNAVACKHPLVLLFDELDGVISQTGYGVDAKVAALFKQQIGTISARNPKVVVIATSNKGPQDFPPEMIRAGRFDLSIYVPVPDYEGRKAIFAVLMEKTIASKTRQAFNYDINFDRLAEATDTMTGADIKEIVRRICAAKAVAEIRTGEVQAPITTEELVKTAQDYKARA